MCVCDLALTRSQALSDGNSFGGSVFAEGILFEPPNLYLLKLIYLNFIHTHSLMQPQQIYRLMCVNQN